MAIVKELYPNGDSRNADGKALGVPLRREAAGALDALNFFYRQRFGKSMTALEGMRGIAQQWHYYDRYINRRPGWTVAAVPGTSMHGWGLAVDLGGPHQSTATVEHAWTAAHAPLFGWEWTGRNFGEPWHFDYTGVNVTAAQRADYLARGAPVTKPEAAPTPPPPKQHLLKEAPMWLAQTVDTKRIYLVTTNGIKWLGAMSTVALFQRLIKYHGGDPAPMSLYQSEVNAIAAEINATVASDIDTREIAKTIADSIRPDIAKAIEGIDVQVGASADEIADEIARRLAA